MVNAPLQHFDAQQGLDGGGHIGPVFGFNNLLNPLPIKEEVAVQATGQHAANGILNIVFF